jgi:hypothetical protein
MPEALSMSVLGVGVVTVRLGTEGGSDDVGESITSCRGWTALDRVAEAVQSNSFRVVVLDGVDCTDEFFPNRPKSLRINPKTFADCRRTQALSKNDLLWTVHTRHEYYTMELRLEGNRCQERSRWAPWTRARCSTSPSKPCEIGADAAGSRCQVQISDGKR